MSDPAISIAMCTYNGSRHVLEQMESFAAQSLLPRELVVCDDVSKDETVEIVREFAGRAPFEVRLVVNETNLGYAQNFAKAVGLASGELILCSDQDDVWHPEKLRKFAEAFRRSPEPGLIFCDANLVDGDLKPMGSTIWRSGKFGPATHRKIEGISGASVILRDPTFIAGATMGFASKYKPLVLPMPEGWSHDAWIATVVALVAPVALIDQPLNDYRQHSTQIYGGPRASVGQVLQLAKDRSSTEDHFQATVRRYQLLEAHMRQTGVATRDPAMLGRIGAKVKHWKARARMRQVSKLARLPLIGREVALGRYRSSSKGWKSMAVDMIY
jgi:glycosyltransferase involved in cell wall biosynthesis